MLDGPRLMGKTTHSVHLFKELEKYYSPLRKVIRLDKLSEIDQYDVSGNYLFVLENNLATKLVDGSLNNKNFHQLYEENEEEIKKLEYLNHKVGVANIILLPETELVIHNRIQRMQQVGLSAIYPNPVDEFSKINHFAILRDIVDFQYLNFINIYVSEEDTILDVRQKLLDIIK